MIETLKNYALFRDQELHSCTLLEDQGYCNENYLLSTDKANYIIRKFKRMDIDRKLEFRVQALAYDRGITAEPLLLDEANDLMISRFLEGEHKERLEESDIGDLAKVLQRLHSIHVDIEPIDLKSLIGLKTDKILRAFETVKKYPSDYVFCHNDLNLRNILFANDLKLIDWEYAGINDRYFDLASVCVEFNLENEQQKMFLDAYFQDEGYSLEKLEAYQVIYNALCEEWFVENNR
ncbi:MAG: hypothetical protein P794_08465 [Epsilonproteobacteria bacterium (ex Lamellibrachia satsuma)]|nr:MAG: hypothetical protein P794_08465 [Epsilonproteobacteria bacterium (ex Lamellibrachia satsuma)]